MSFGDKVIEKASDRPLQNIGPTPDHFMPTEPSTHLNVDTTTFTYGVGPNFLSLRTWAIFHGIETFCDISELQGIAAIVEGYILI